MRWLCRSGEVTGGGRCRAGADTSTLAASTGPGEATLTTPALDQDHGTIVIPEAAHTIPPTPAAELDQALETLTERAPAWAAMGLEQRLELLRDLVEATLAAAPAWVTRAAAAKGIRRDSPVMGEEWLGGPVLVLRYLKLLERTLEDIRRTGRPQPPSLEVAPDGRVVATVLPTDVLDRLLFTGFKGEVRLQPGVTLEQAEADMGRLYRPGHEPRPGVAVVLGAGNVSSIGPTDALHQLFAHGRVAVLKLNPVNEHLGPHIAEAFQPLIREGYLRIAYGGTDVGSYLTSHAAVDAIHVTGSDKTHDAIVFGTGAEGARRKAAGTRRNDKELTAELGNVTPVIVVPGPWSRSDLAYHGDNIASMLVQNAGFNCVAARVVVQHRAWAKRAALLDAVRASLRHAEPRVPYYPGARQRWQQFVEAHRTAEWFSDDDEDRVPFTLIPDLDPGVADDIAFRTEAFCGLMGEVGLDAPRSVPDFLDAAVAFCNDTLWGTLAATILVHPRSLRDPAIAAAVDRAIARLRYGTVVVNHFPAAAYGSMSTPWGAYPGADPTDIQSGRGFVHNTFLLEGVEKSVVRGPFRTPTTPVWFHTHRTAHELAPALARLTATREPAQLPALAWHTLRA